MRNFLTLSAAAILAFAQTPRTVWDGAYSAEQAKRGAAQVAAKCAACHGGELKGGPGAPGVAGPEFLFSWNNKSAGELFDYIKANMPPGEPGSMSDQRYADIVAAVFQANGFPPGGAELSPDAKIMAGIKIVREKP
jgi:mono/diheme cytochrome c family protein